MKTSQKLFTISFILTSLILGQAYGKAKATKQKLTEAEYITQLNKLAPISPYTPEYPFLSVDEQAQIKTFINKQRNPANADGSARSQEYIELSQELIDLSGSPTSAKNPTANTDRLDAYLAKLETNYNSYKSEDTKLFASQLIPLRQLRGIVWKMIGLFKDQKTHPSHVAALSAFKEFAGNMRLLSPDENWRLGFDYITQPYVRYDETKKVDIVSEQLEDIVELQGHIAGPLYNSLVVSKNRLKAINANKADQPILWNQQIAFGPKSFVDDVGQFKKVGELEKQLLLSDIYFSLAQIASMRAYSLNGTLELGFEYGKLFGINGFLPWSTVEGVTAEDQHRVLRNHPKVGVGFTDRKEKMEASLDHLRNAALALNMAWGEAKSRPAGTIWAINTGFLKLDPVYGDKKISDFRKALNGPIPIRNGISGEEATIDLAAFYTKSPERLSDLLPKEPFNRGINGKEWIPVNLKSQSGKTYPMSFRDYFKGSPENWNVNAYKNIFPKANTSADVKRSLRVLSSSFGSFLTVGPTKL